MTEEPGGRGAGADSGKANARSEDAGREQADEARRGMSDARNRPTREERAPEVFYCDLCGNVMLNLHCKLICERCGYRRDCSDP